MQKTGQCFHRDESEKLWLAESFVDEYEYVSTQDTEVFEEE
jgi:hypothetical protein